MKNNLYKKILIIFASIPVIYTITNAVDIVSNGTIVNSQDNNFTGDYTLTSDATTSTVGNTTTNTNNEGTLSIGHNVTTNSIGSVTNSIKALNITANTTTFNASAYVTTTTISSGATLSTSIYNLSGNVINVGTMNVGSSSTITGSVTNDGLLVLGSEEVIGNINGTGSIHITQNYNALGSVNANSLIVYANRTLDISHTASIASNTALYGSAAKIESDENTNLGNITIYNNDKSFRPNETYTLVDMTSNNDLTVSSITGPSDTSLIKFSTSSVSDAITYDKIDVTTRYATTTELSLTGNDANTYLGATSYAITNDTAILDEMYNMSANEIKNAISTMNPNTFGVSEGTINLSESSLEIISKHLSSTRLTTHNVYSNDKNIWGEVYYSSIEQESSNGIPGYESKTQGIVFGVDKSFSESGFTYGIALGLGKNEVESTSELSKAQTDTSNLQVITYANQNFDNFYLEGMLSYSQNKNEGNRDIVIGTINRKAKANYNSNILATKAAVGSQMHLGGFNFNPKASIEYTNLSTDNFTETGAGSMNLNVSTKDFSKITANLGFDLSLPIIFQDDSALLPEIRAGIKYNMGDNFTITNSTFEVGGTSFETKGLQEDNTSINYGVGLRYISSDKLSEFHFDYDRTDKNEYSQELGSFSSKFKF